MELTSDIKKSFDTVRSRQEYMSYLLAQAHVTDSAIDSLIETLNKRGFFIAPASSRFHGDYAGGLFDHSVMVADTLKKLTKDNNLIWQNESSPTIVGLFHDLCKIDEYKLNVDKDCYERNTECLIKGHGIKSVIYTQGLGVPLNEEEIACIIYHMGAFTDSTEWNNYTRAVKAYPNVLWTHHADMIASQIMGV